MNHHWRAQAPAQPRAPARSRAPPPPPRERRPIAGALWLPWPRAVLFMLGLTLLLWGLLAAAVWWLALLYRTFL